MQSSHPGRGGEPRATVGSRPVLPCRPRKPFQAKRDDPLRRDPAMEGARRVTGPGGCRTVDAGFAPTQRTPAVASLTDRVGRLGQSGGRPRRQRAGRPATSSTPRAAHPAPDGRTRTAVAVGRPPSLRCAPHRRLAADSRSLRPSGAVGAEPGGLAELEGDKRLGHRHRLLAPRAHLPEVLGRYETAACACRVAARRTVGAPERRHLTRRALRPQSLV